MRLFQEHGYEATTMRAIAREAGVATGNAYYYFSSKDELVREYYARVGDEHAIACRGVLASETAFGPRLRGVLRALVEAQAPYRSFGAAVYARTTDTASPLSPLSPFSKEAASARAAGISLYAAVVSGSRLRVPGYLRDRLPSLLWLHSVAVMLFWARDTSPGSQADDAAHRHNRPARRAADHARPLPRVPDGGPPAAGGRRHGSRAVTAARSAAARISWAGSRHRASRLGRNRGRRGWPRWR